MANSNCLEGMRCPKCGSEGPFRIEVRVMAMVHDDGTDLLDGDTEWDKDSSCVCGESKCEHFGTVEEFTSAPTGGASAADQPVVH